MVGILKLLFIYIIIIIIFLGGGGWRVEGGGGGRSVRSFDLGFLIINRTDLGKCTHL